MAPFTVNGHTAVSYTHLDVYKRQVLEFGSRRAQGTDGAISGARAAYIGGCKGTACTISDQLYGVPAGGTMAHAWVQMFDSQYEAFKTYCQIYPHNATLLVLSLIHIYGPGASLHYKRNRSGVIVRRVPQAAQCRTDGGGKGDVYKRQCTSRA